MDPVTHIASGLLGAQATAGRFPRSRAFYPFCVLAAWVPDIDNLASLFGRSGYLALHRGLTHSLVGVPLTALALTALFKLFRAPLPWLKSWLLATALGLVHVYLDLITTYGTQVLAPFSNERFALPAVFIIDPFLTGTMLVFILLAHLAKPKRALLAAAGLMWIVVYPLTNLSIGNAARAWAAHSLKEQGVAVERVYALPDPLAPIYWKVIGEGNHTWAVAGMSMLSPGKLDGLVFKDKANRTELRGLGEQADMFNTFEWFSDYPYEERSPEGNSTRLVFGDLRFYMVQPWFRRLRSGKPHFSVTALLGPDGRLIEYGYLGRPLTRPGDAER